MSYGNNRNPIPNTGRKQGFKYYFKTYHRLVKTVNEMRQYYTCENKQIRGARNVNRLYKAFDDVSRHQERSWKRQSKRARQNGYNQSKIHSFFHKDKEE